MGSPNIRNSVYDVLKSMEGEEVPLSIIIEQTGHKREQIITALNNMRRVSGLPVEPVVRGYSYQLRKGPNLKEELDNTPPTTDSVAHFFQTDKRVFEEIGVTRTGTVIIQDRNGGLYKAEEL